MSPFPDKNGIVGILLAAGASRRMGTPKPLLLWQGEPLVRRMARTLLDGGAESLIVVIGPNEVGSAITDSIKNLPGIISIVNPSPEQGMLSSVQAGMQEAQGKLPNIAGWLVCPCDLPLLEPAHVARLLSVWEGDGQCILVPTAGEKRGHPTLFGNLWATEILRMDAKQVGLNHLLARHPAAVREVSVEDTAILHDADTPEEWQALLKREEK